MSKSSKRPRLQITVASDIAPRHVFTHSSNTATRTRQIVTTTGDLEPTKTTTPDYFTPVSVEDFPASDELDLPAGVEVLRKAKRYVNSDVPLLTWKKYRGEYLDACLILEGRGRFHQSCANPSCELNSAPNFRCLDCFGYSLFCKECIVSAHHINPLHRIEEWKTHFFQSISLRDLGVRIQLGHKQGENCPFRQRGHKDFVVLESSGVHSVAIDFCGCVGSHSHYLQLLEVGWWPSTPLEPQTAATMSVLRLFHVTNLQGQVTPTDFYRTLEKMSSGDGLSNLPDRLAQWMLMVREWRHIKMAKRAGRAHDSAGIEATVPGGLSIPCRACPHPNINLPLEWAQEPAETRWLYSLILAEDANFKQKARARSNITKDPPLGPGWGTFVENEAYLRHISTAPNKTEISHCVGFAAMWNANSKKSEGLRATGIGAVICARHAAYRPNGMGDLQKGERYVNMDYLFFSSIAGTSLSKIIGSYDIACQWGRHLRDRLESAIPRHLQPPPDTKFEVFVPKFHLPAHKPQCHAPYSFNYAKGVGRTDGEGIERNWSVLNKVAPSLSMMGPGGRWDTMDDVCNYWNWQKTINLDSTLLQKMTWAIREAVIHHRALVAFTESLQAENGELVRAWEDTVRRWEHDPLNVPCPYDIPEENVTWADVKRQLALEDHFEVEARSSLEGNITPSAFIVAALELEEAQQSLRLDVQKISPDNVTKATSILRRKTSLLKRIQSYISTRAQYMPGLDRYLHTIPSHSDDNSSLSPELIPVHLPSSLPSELRATVCVPGLAEIEDRLRYAQASEALTDLRCQLTKRTYASRYRIANISSQTHFTRFRELQEQTDSKIKLACLRYRVARSGLVHLREGGDWEQRLQELHPEDVRGLSESALVNEEKQQKKRTWEMAGISTSKDDDLLNQELPPTSFNPRLAVGEGHRTLSWIWYSTSNGEIDGETTTRIGSYLRVEWLKCRARANRWKEEVQLVEEEMRRSLDFGRWLRRWWLHQKDNRKAVATQLQEGMIAYASEMADKEERRCISWAMTWASIRDRAQVILKRHLNGDKETEDGLQVPFSKLTVEIDIEDEHELFDEPSDTE